MGLNREADLRMNLSQSCAREVLLTLGPTRGHHISGNTEIRFESPHLIPSQSAKQSPGFFDFELTEPVRFFCSMSKTVFFSDSSWTLEAEIVRCQ